MIKKILLLITLSVIFLTNTNGVFASEKRPGEMCVQKGGDICCNSPIGPCVNDGTYKCLPNTDGFTYMDGSTALKCQEATVENTFGQIQPPDALKGFLKKDPTGTGAISNFLSNLVALMFSLAGIVFIFMLIWGAFDWLMSGGDKEKISSAQKKIINAIIGLILFAIAFAVIRLLGAVTGFTSFFE